MAIPLPPKLEKYFNRLSIKSRFFNRVLSFFFMPFVHKSGLKMNFVEDDYYAILPKRRINTNWYGTMAGGAILGNSELAAGSYLFMLSKGEYRMICTRLNYRFLLPSLDSIMYKAYVDLEELAEKIKAGGKFNIDMTLKVFRINNDKAGRRIGSGTISFHMWPVGS
ncbi:hypothetical protein KJ365_06945 [Glaciecola sp. XM2]|jgi:hypothetical protein|uniref:hypothetical protein n=1 Tax=Glaciecola sp. XM2 TaxID=1914931 RepID=UPI001BDF2A8F|nr:hypothetical protein [Glaciecola sp. XM2]MBT1450616.1 hypothetical protein [Glaciecola sp. XM2]